MFRTAIIYEKPDCVPLCIAKISDRGLLAAASRVAIDEAQRDVEDLREQDSVLCEIQTHELAKLRRVLDLLTLYGEDAHALAVM